MTNTNAVIDERNLTSLLAERDTLSMPELTDARYCSMRLLRRACTPCPYAHCWTECCASVPSHELHRATFNRWRDAIYEQFGIMIDCQKVGGYLYYIDIISEKHRRQIIHSCWLDYIYMLNSKSILLTIQELEFWGQVLLNVLHFDHEYCEIPWRLPSERISLPSCHSVHKGMVYRLFVRAA